MKKVIHYCILYILLLSCSEKNEMEQTVPPNTSLPEFISAVDISSLPEIEQTNPRFFDENGKENDFLSILKQTGINTIRLRLWVNPDDKHCGFEEVKAFSQRVKEHGFSVWLTLHYSDTWADPGHQETPEQWQNLPFSQLRDSVYNYTSKVVQKIQPQCIQIGNEINNGFLHPHGHNTSNQEQFVQLIECGVRAVREHAPDTQIMLHVAGTDNANWFFQQVNEVDYDIIGLSYYPLWHGKDLHQLHKNMQTLGQTYNKKVLIAEAAYPFTLDWNDWTTNIVGSEDQLILPDYPATPKGQADFIKEIKKICKNTENTIGFCYWGGELIAWKGTQASDASPWENQALFNFQNQALPVLREF